MTIADAVKKIPDVIDRCRVQFIHECLLSVQSVKRKKAAPAHTRVTFATTNMSPNDAFYYASGSHPALTARRPEFVGVIVWVPSDDYQRWAESEAQS